MKEETKSIIIAGIAVIVLGFLIYLAIILLELYDKSDNSKEQTFLVVNITDGDTFVIATGESVRLICVDTPEKGQEGYQEAKDFLSSLILGEQVRLERDENATASEDKDKYDRLLRYVYLNTTFINKEIVRGGYGTLFPYGNSTSKCDEIGEK